MKDCPDCGVRPEQRHEHGCDIEYCALCGGQLISCPCVYITNGMDLETLESEHPVIDEEGPTEEMWAVYDARVEREGGRLEWTGTWPGVAECAELGWWARRNPKGPGWLACKKEDPGAQPDLNRYWQETSWDPKLRRRMLKQ